ncbi:MAG: hypothetical protein P1U86_09430 [Verrucomicrobiales bacterium]|nr:hypothetical protein [Verrucomicrobiales bacterium]
MRVPRFSINRNGAHLIALPAILSLCDIGVTLLFQPKAYWAGDLSLASDANPAVRIALSISPLLAIPAAIVWVTFISLMMTTLSPLWRRRSYLFLCIAHLVFVWGWIIRWDGRLGAAFAFVAGTIAIIMHRQILADRCIENSKKTSVSG